VGQAGEFKRRIQMFFRRDQFRRELEEEMGMHVELRSLQQMDRGLSPQEARRAAHLKFGNLTRIQEKSVMTWGSEMLESFWSDILYGARALFRSPVLSLVALLSLALGIGANTAIFSLLDAVLLRSLPVRDPQQLILLGTGDASGIGHSIVNTELYSYPFYRQLQEKNAVFSSVAAIFSMTDEVHGFLLNGAGESSTESQLMHVNLVSGTYFPMLGVQAEIGRTLTDADDTSEGDHPVVVVSHGFWKRSMASDPSVLHRKIKLGTTIFTIVGVTPAEFFGTRVGESPDMWVPLSMTKLVPPGWDAYNKNFVQSLNVMGRLKPGVSLAEATANVNLLLQQITRGFSDADLSQKNLDRLNKTRVPLTPMANGLSWIRQQFSEPLQILMAVVALVLLIACANIANLLLARSTARSRELAVRQALGARRGRLIRQLLTESLLLALMGGLLGIGFAVVGNRFLLRMVSDGFEPLPLNVGLDFRLLGFSFAVTVATAILFGTIPAFRATRLQLNDALREGRGPSGARARSLLSKVLVISQVSLSLLLLVGAGLFLRSLVNLNHMDAGFDRENVLRLQVETDVTGYKEDDPRLNALYREIESRVSALPGVKATSFSSFTFHEGSWNSAVLVPGMPNNAQITVHQNVVGNGYFDTMRIPLVAGRVFSSSDTATSQRVAVISEHIAKTLFPPGNPLGRHFRLGDNKPEHEFEVIGIVKDVKFDSLQEDTENVSYLSYAQRPWSFGDFEVRYAGDFNTVSLAVQQAIKSINHDVRITHVTTLDEQVARSMTNQRLVTQLSGFFGMLAAFLCAIGIYGLMSYIVSRRTNEIGLRMALGAARSNVSWLVMRETLLLAGIGIVIGIPAVLASQRLIANMLFGIKGTDPLSLAGAVAVLLLVAITAGYLPARRASKVDPMIALRYE
jgi:predicted permease